MARDYFSLLNRHVSVSQETFDRLSIYHDLLLKWQSKINLIGPETVPECWHRHFLDSLQLLPHIDNLSKRITDLGSGAGFPGMVLAIASASDVHLIESDARKIIFLREVKRLTDTSVMIHHNRIEDRSIDSASVIVSRACAPLDALLPLASFYFSHGTNCLFHKGKNYFKEIEDAEKQWQFDYDIVPSVTDDQGVILKLSDVRERKNDSAPGKID